MQETVFGLYNEYDDARSAMNDLIRYGFIRSDISVVTNNEDGTFVAGAGNEPMGELTSIGEGAVLGGLAGLTAGIATLAIPGVGPIFAIGPIAALLTGAGLGVAGGGILGALDGLGIPRSEAEILSESVRRGGSMLTLQTDSARATEARGILQRHHPVDIQERSGTHRFQPVANDPDLYADEDTLLEEQTETPQYALSAGRS